MNSYNASEERGPSTGAIPGSSLVLSKGSERENILNTKERTYSYCKNISANVHEIRKTKPYSHSIFINASLNYGSAHIFARITFVNAAKLPFINGRLL